MESTKRSFRLNIAFMQFCGLYPSEKHSVLDDLKAVLFYVFFCLLFELLTVIELCVQRNTAIVQTNIGMILATNVAAVCLKIPSFLKQKYRIKKCIDFFEDALFVPKNPTEKKMVEECVHVCRRNTTAFFLGSIIAIIFWAIPFLRAHQLPFDVWVPYDIANPFVFYSTFVYVITSAHYVGFIEAAMDPLIGGLAFQATTHLKILKYNIQHLADHVDVPRSADVSQIKFQDLCTFLRNCVERHNRILEFVNEYEKCCSSIVFFQFAGSTMSLCFALVVLAQVSATSSGAITCLTTFCFIAFEILFYCFYGTLLYEENEGFIQAIYMGPWYKYDVRIRKVLITMMERSKQPMIVTAGKVVNVTIQTFAAVLKTSYSLIAVFK